VISRTGSHTLKALAALSRIPDGSYVGAAELARPARAPANYLGKLLRQLSRAGIVQGRKGGHGGFRLSRSASSIALFDVLRPIEHLPQTSRCLLSRSRCRGGCPVHQGWTHARDTYLEFLKTTTLADLAGDRPKKERAAETAAGGL
jgi:Rrf2 family protein